MFLTDAQGKSSCTTPARTSALTNGSLQTLFVQPLLRENLHPPAVMRQCRLA